MALKTSSDKTGPDERKTDSKSSKGKINDTKKSNVPEYTKKSKVNKRRNYKKHTGISTRINTTFTFASSGIPNSVFYEEYSTCVMPCLPTSYPVFACYPQYLASPVEYNWNSLVNTCLLSPVCSFSGYYTPVVSNLVSTQHVSPYACPVIPPVLAEPVLPLVSPIIELVSPLNDFRRANVFNHNVASFVNVYSEGYVGSFIGEPIFLTDDFTTNQEPLEFYLSLPKELFPTAKMLSLDPNPIIDEICRQEDIYKHTSCILDLEFGVPRAAVSRPIATYDVQFNSIHCKNTPGAVHPGFDSCSQNFKKAFLSYYDCVISTWYRGYMMINADESVVNFQYWLQYPMQVLGMCWP